MKDVKRNKQSSYSISEHVGGSGYPIKAGQGGKSGKPAPTKKGK